MQSLWYPVEHHPNLPVPFGIYSPLLWVAPHQGLEPRLKAPKTLVLPITPTGYAVSLPH